MKINESILRKIIRESIAGLIREYEEGDEDFGPDPEISEFELPLSDLICYLPDGELKNTIKGMGEDELYEAIPQLSDSYYMKVGYYKSYDGGDYWTPPSSEISSIWVASDGGLLDDVNAITSPEIKNAFLIAYKGFEKAVERGDYNDSIY